MRQAFLIVGAVILLITAWEIATPAVAKVTRFMDDVHALRGQAEEWAETHGRVKQLLDKFEKRSWFGEPPEFAP